MGNFYFPLCSLFCALLLLIVFFNKPRVNNYETKIFRGLLIFNFINAMLSTLVIYLGIKGYDTVLIIAIKKIDFLQYILWTWYFTLYLYYISYNPSEKVINDIYRISGAVNVFLIVIVCILPCTLTINGSNLLFDGLSPNVLYTISALYTTLMTIIVVLNSKKFLSEKYAPIHAFLIMTIVAIVIRHFFPGVSILQCIMTYIDLIMYFTIENPDVNLLEEVEKAKVVAEKANDSKSKFLSTMSHEIRTPLNAIVGFSNEIQRDESLEQIKADASDIVYASQNLLEIVNGILNISKIEAGKMEIIPTDYNIRALIEDLSNHISNRIDKSKVEFIINIAPDVPAVLHGDESKLHEVILNLFTNAVKYTSIGSITCEINCINHSNICDLVISVRDTGRGIRTDKIDTLFKKFSRLEEEKNSTLEGTGLGLAVTKQLVEMMNGKIVVQSEFGVGSTFTVYLSQTIVNMDRTEETVQKVKTYKDKKVLVVDDNILNLKLASRLLLKYEIQTDLCTSGEKCLEKLQTSKYDLILLDDMMPNMSGIETFKEIKKQGTYTNPIVVLTANVDATDKKKYLDLGFDSYMSKPIDKEQLVKILNKYL